MGVGTDVYSQRVHAELVDDSIAKRLLKVAVDSRQGRGDAAEDLVQSALVRVLGDDASKWDPAGGKTFFAHVAYVIANLARNERRRARMRREVVDSPKEDDEGPADGRTPTDEALDEARRRAWLEKVQAATLAELDADDPKAAAMYRALLEGHERPAIAERLGWTPNDVHLAYDRIKNRMRKVADRERGAEDERLHARRAAIAEAAPEAPDAAPEGVDG